MVIRRCGYLGVSVYQERLESQRGESQKEGDGEMGGEGEKEGEVEGKREEMLGVGDGENIEVGILPHC